jgi:hypothetical protein
MTTLTVADLPLDRAGASRHLRCLTGAVRIHFLWWGTHKTLTPPQKEAVGIACGADSWHLSVGKKLIDTRHPAFRTLTSLRSRAIQYWRGATLPFPEPGIRLLRHADVADFVHQLQDFRAALRQAEQGLNAAFDSIQDDARRRLGRLYDPHDYPANVRGLFDLSWDFPTVEPPSYLLHISPETYQQEQERVTGQFTQAVRLAEQAFFSEFAKLVGYLVQRLEDDGAGKGKIFRDRAVSNLLEFFNRFERLSIGSHAELERLAAQAQELVRGVPPQTLQTNDELRQHLAEQLSRVQHALESMLVDCPRRRLAGMQTKGGADRQSGP